MTTEGTPQRLEEDDRPPADAGATAPDARESGQTAAAVPSAPPGGPALPQATPGEPAAAPAKESVQAMTASQADHEVAAAATTASSGVRPAASPSPVRTLEGEGTSAPRSPVVTVLLAITGLLLARAALFLVLRFVLSVRRPSEVRLTPEGGLILRSRTEMLGRVLRERETIVPRDGLVRATREVRFPSLPMYAGLVALVLGSYVGMGLLTDGLRAASPSLVATGLLLVLAGLGVDFVLTSVVPGSTGRCRVFFLLARGAPLCVEVGDADLADRFLAELARR